METTRRNNILYKIMDKPVIAGIIMTAIFMMLLATFGRLEKILGGGSSTAEIISNIILIIIITSLYLLYRKVYQNEIPHTLSVKAFFKGMLYTMPMWGLGVFVLTTSILGLLVSAYTPVSFAFVISCIFNALEAGICEDVVLRGLFSGNSMRVNHNPNKLLFNAAISSVVFGLIHTFNLLAGAGLMATISQVLYATGFGLLLSAAYFRTGTIVPGIIAHFILDCFMFIAGAIVSGSEIDPAIMTDSGSPLVDILRGVILFSICAIITLILLRKSKRQEVFEIFEN